MTSINFKSLKKLIVFLNYNFVPRFLQLKLIGFFEIDINKIRLNTGIRAEDYFQAYKKELSSKETQNINKYYLHKAFKKHLVRSNLIDDLWWSDFLLLSSLPNNSKFNELNQSLINRIEVSNFNSLEYFEILDIYALCLRLSFFELGYHIRKKSLKIALSYIPISKNNETWKLKAKLSALIETGNFSEFDKLFPLFKTKKKQEKSILNFLRVIFDSSKNPLDIKMVNKLDTNQDQIFRKFVENKKIVIVGPAPVRNQDGDNIDTADIVLRTNYKMGDPIIKGSKCDINYFNLETAQHISNKGCLEWPSRTSWIVGKARSYMEIILKRLSSDGIDVGNLNVRTLKRVDFGLFNGSLSLIQNIIVDLSRYNPRDIFLYHFDVMLSKDRIVGYYTDVNNNEELRLKMLKCFPGHDPVTQFLILKFFWKLNFIKGDSRFEEVISMDAEDYMKNMQKNYLN